MTVPAPHLQDLVTGYLRGHPDEQPLLPPLLDRLAAGDNVTDRQQFDGHVTTSGIVINDADDVLLIHHLASGRWIQPGGHLESSDRTLGEAVRREIAEETGVTGLETFGDGTPVHIDVHMIEARPDKGEPAHVHYDACYLFRARGPLSLTLQAEEVGAARWRPASELGDPVLRARVLSSLGRPREDRPADVDPYCALVVITDLAATKVLMHLRDDKPGIWALSTWAPLSGGAEPDDTGPHATARRELSEEIGLEDVRLMHLFSTHTDGYPRHVFHGVWDGDPGTLTLTEGRKLAFIPRGDFDQVPIHPATRQDTDQCPGAHHPTQPPCGYATLALIANRRGQLLMHLRGDSPGTCWPDTWSPNGGKPEAADTGPRGTICREVHEEVGLDEAAVSLSHLAGQLPCRRPEFRRPCGPTPTRRPTRRQHPRDLCRHRVQRRTSGRARRRREGHHGRHRL
ncbi:NUDIX hydrolase [Streptomyces sp. NPDC052016]|uniref:NUDIX hydrolase n=1 Tax=Streptomyces sp. NPDC052016 TaxID=3365680 RepID=UPI0037D6C030